MAAIKAAATLNLLPLTPETLEDICRLQQLTMTSPWSISQWQQILGERYCAYIGAVEGIVCGAVVFSTVLDEAELETIFVHPDFRTQGVASALLNRAFKCLGSEINTVFLEVDTDNTTAIALYERFLFKAVNVRKAYYTHSKGSGDALIMARQQ